MGADAEQLLHPAQPMVRHTSALVRPRSAERALGVYAGLFLLGTALIAGYMWFHIDHERRVALEHWKARLSTLADARSRVVGSWLDARRADGEVLAAFPAVRAILAGAPDGGARGESGGAALPLLERVAAAHGYHSIFLVHPGGRVLAASDGAGRLDPGHIEAARAAAQSRKFRAELDPEGSRPRLLSFMVPVGAAGDERGTARPALGVIVLRMDPATGLFPLLHEETVRTRTGETLLFGHGGRAPAYLSPLRHSPAGWAAVARSLQVVTGLAARAAARPEQGFDEVTDYREVPVLAATRALASTGWGLVLKIDREEALQEFYDAGKMAGLAAGFLTVALAGFLFSVWRQQQRAHLLREQMRQQRAIVDLKSYAEKIVASVPAGLLVLSGGLRVLSANRSFLTSFALRSEDVLGRPVHAVIQAPGLDERAGQVLQTGTAQHDVMVEVLVVLHGKTHPVRMTLTGIQLAGQDDARLLLILQDLTEEERLQAARRTSEERFRDLVQGLDAVVWEADAESLRFSFVSQRAEAVLGYPVDRWLLDRDFWAGRIHPDDRERVVAACRAAAAEGRPHELEYRAVTADGRTRWLRDIIQVARDRGGQVRQLRGVTVDLTEGRRAEEALRQSEEALRQAQKMEAVGQLAGGIAHDFNNLLMVIRGDSDLMLRRLRPEDGLRRNAESVRDAADQAAALTRQLLAFSRKQVLAPRLLDLNEILAGMHAMLERLLGETIQLVTVPGEGLGRVKADPSQIEQVIMNLAVNARDAMPDGGRLTVETCNAGFDETAVRLEGAGTPGRYVVLSVTDTGVGMDPETRARLFEPFFTTKELGKGTGLGLSTVYGIVKQSGGHIWVYSEVRRGTTFKICFPQAGETAEQPESAPPTEVARGAETVLLVEDAQRVREVVREILEMSGYRVLPAGLGPDAIELARQHAGPIQLLITDVVMPQMSGRELAQRLTALRPDLRVLYMSGYTDDAIVRHGVLAEGMPFLSKPFTPEALAAKVREVLDGSRPGRPAPTLAGANGGPPSTAGGRALRPATHAGA
jgi:PAS domain S-box-containing protein